jgi:predicted CoA-substrate-specific enzyme activase
MKMQKNILGIDIGSVSVSLVEINGDHDIVSTVYRKHHGDLNSTLKDIFSARDMTSISAIAQASSAGSKQHYFNIYDPHVSIIRGVKKKNQNCASILYVGGERFGLIEFDEEGNYSRTRVNSSCAAGTGSFLDQQAKRLSLSGIEDLCRIAAGNNGAIPKIASRCAVFAKTDLIHAQQEGYSLAEICDGLCMGLAKNIADTLFSGETIRGPLVVAGGVALNDVVMKHLGDIIGQTAACDAYAPYYGAYGAALTLLDDENARQFTPESLESLMIGGENKKSYYYDPLEITMSDYPHFSSNEQYLFTPSIVTDGIPVEIDIYADVKKMQNENVYIGFDIGSTSTKASVINDDDEVIAGFYTRTAGRPLDAVRSILESIQDIFARYNISWKIKGVGSTGSGRKFIGKIIGADLVLDEITAHARAAFELNPDVDTIIEIGGQDAKFTTLRNGMVNFSVMNTVCAAGTGSFIEEQAGKLDCALADYSPRTVGKKSPIASDRCTVFMERDINHLLSGGYDVDEALAAVLHSVRDNYISKVAIEGMIGDHICFQGATAKNRALVAAFEQKLKKPIFVSKYCHLTGALGVAYTLRDDKIQNSRFRGVEMFRNVIPVTSEVCELCTNHCKIKIAEVGGQSVAYGFLCGRDYDSKTFVDSNATGFDMIKERLRISAVRPAKNNGLRVGLPAALYMAEDMPLWKLFWEHLGVVTLSSEGFKDAMKQGKRIAGAEFCAPMSAAHGHVAYLAEHADFIFFPVYIEGKNSPDGARRQYCYYSQYMPTLAANIPDIAEKGKFISPVINHSASIFQNVAQLYKSVKEFFPDVSIFDVYSAYSDAADGYAKMKSELVRVYDEKLDGDDVKVVFIGRPYTLLLPSMNKGIPGLFSALGVKSIFQDMIAYDRKETESIEPLLSTLHWQYASKILEVAEVAAKRDGLYPVFVTSFKCSPDSFVMEYFKRIMDQHGKPYLILQLDEHDSNVGYETRIESAIRAFRNHHGRKDIHLVKKHLPVNPVIVTELNKRTLLIPNWDPIGCRLVTAALIRAGIDARLLEEDETVIAKSMRHNTGQCIPINTIAQEVIEYVQRHHLRPENTALWMLESGISCNVKLYPAYIKSILEAHGSGLEKTAVYVGQASFVDLGPTVSLAVYFAYLFGGMIRKLGCRIRPYEENEGETDRIIDQCVQYVYGAIISDVDREDIAQGIVKLFEPISRKEADRPKVAIFGDLYTRDNDVMNQNLIRSIEDAGGEAVITSYTEYVRMVASPCFKRWFNEGKYRDFVTGETLMALINRLDKKYYKYFEPLLGVPYPEYDDDFEEILRQYNVTTYHAGESLDNLLKTSYLAAHYNDLSLFVQASPAFCCPSLVTEAMALDIERVTGVPVVAITYDGTASNRNDVIKPYIAFPRKRKDVAKEDVIS